MKRSRFALIASQAFGQLSIVLASPFLTRIFEPDEFGKYQLAFTLGVLLQPIVTLRSEFLIPSQKDEAAVTGYIGLVARSLTITAAVLGIAALLSTIIFSSTYGILAIMIAAITISYSLMAVDNAVLIRQKETGRLAVRNLLSGTMTATLQVVFAYLLGSVFWLAFAILIGRLGAVAVTRKTGTGVVRSVFSSERIPINWSRTLYGVSSGFVSSLSLSGLTLYSQAAYGLSATAYVGLAQRSARAPLGFVSQALSQSVQGSIGEAVRTGDKELLRRVNREMVSLLPFSVATTLGLIVLGPLLADPVFGEGWKTTGHIIAVLGVPSGLQLLVAPITPVFYMLGAEKRLFWIQLSRLILALLGAACLQATFNGLIFAVAGYSLGLSIGYIYTYFALRQVVIQAGLGSPTIRGFEVEGN